MNHFIWITDINDKTLYMLAGQVLTFARHDTSTTIITLVNGNTLLTKTSPQDLETRINKYLNDMLDFMNKRNNDLL